MRIRSLMISFALLFFASAAQASVIFDVDGPGSSIDYTPDFGGCITFFGPVDCVDVDLASDLDDVFFGLASVGDSFSFDFAQVTFASALGGEVGGVSATLAFSSPGGVAIGQGEAEHINAFGLIQAGSLIWNAIADIELPSGITYGVEFEELSGINLGSTASIGATVTLLEAAVPEPMTLSLIGLGLLGLGALRRRSRVAA